MALSPQIVQAIAQDGVKGDTLLGHLTRGDTVIPRQAPPAVHDIARQSMAAHGMDVNRFVAGAPGNHINPKTGLHSFEDGGDGGDGGGGGGGGEGGEGGGDGSGGGSGPSGGGDKSGGEVGSGGGAQGGDPSGGAGGPGDTGAGGGGGTGPSGGGDKSGGAVGSGGGAQTDSGPSDTSDTGTSSGTKSSTAAEEAQAQSTSGKTASQALLGVDFSDLGPAGKLAMGVVPGMTTLAGLNEMTAHGVDQPSNPGGNLSAADTGGVGMGAGGPSDPGASSGGAGSEHPASVQGVLNNQTVGGSNGGTAAPDEPSNPTKQQTPVTPTDPFTDLKAALAAAHGIDKSPTFTSGSDAEILNAILGPQRAAAEQQLQNAHMRGTLSDQGYNSAELGLGTQDQQANSRIGNISDNLLAAYQQKLDAYANQAVTAAGGTQQGSPWDVTPWQSGYNSLLSTLQGREKGDLLNLLPSGGSLYDIPTLLANAGNAQGLYNPGGSPIQQALSDQRGLGTTGVF